MSKSCCKNNRGRPKTLPDENQRQVIIKGARQLFLEHGYGATKTEEIAARCKISKQTLYRLFPGKASMFAAVVEANRPQWLELPVPEDLPLQTALERIFRIDISEAEDQERLQFIGMTLAEGRHHPELHEITKTCGTGRAHATLAEWMQRQADLGRINLAEDALKTARMICDMVFGALLMKTLGEVGWPSCEARRTHIRAAIRVFLHGVCRAPPD